MRPARVHVFGVLAFLALSAAWMGAVALVWDRNEAGPRDEQLRSGAPSRRRLENPDPARAEASSRSTTASSMQAATWDPAQQRAHNLAQRLAQIVDRDGSDDEVARLEQELLALGELAATPLVALLKSERDIGRHNQLLDFLRKVPGAAAEAYFIAEVASGAEKTSRTIAMDELSSRRSDAALAALNRVATSDPDVPREPFLAAPRKPDDTSTELPDAVFTPRMKAMQALAATEDPRVVPMLSSVVLNERDESLRMEAATQLGRLRTNPEASDALLQALHDPSAYVRLAALHSISGSDDPRLPAVLGQLSQLDPDLGVRALARQISSAAR